MSFQGDIAVLPKEKKTYEATPEMRKYGVALGVIPFLYGLYLLLFHERRRGGSERITPNPECMVRRRFASEE